MNTSEIVINLAIFLRSFNRDNLFSDVPQSNRYGLGKETTIEGDICNVLKGKNISLFKLGSDVSAERVINGATLIFTDPENWFEEAKEMMLSSKFIFALAGNNSGFKKELQFLSTDQQLLSKTILIFPDFEYDESWSSLLGSLGYNETDILLPIKRNWDPYDY